MEDVNDIDKTVSHKVGTALQAVGRYVVRGGVPVRSSPFRLRTLLKPTPVKAVILLGVVAAAALMVVRLFTATRED